MRTFASLLFLFLFLQATSQRECASQAYNKPGGNISKTITATTDAIKVSWQQQSHDFITGNAIGETKTNIIRIPVVVHVLYNTAAQNISEAQIRSGIAALNRDFRRQNKDAVNTPERFRLVAADAEIEFVLATADPSGVATNGIVRKQTAVPAFNMDDQIKFSAQGGDNAWDSRLYLNIWLGNTRRLLGYATMPGGDEKLDGLVINITAFGTINTAAPYNLGRTAVHEAGHWLGLQHLWGDEACGDDGVDDTPKQGGYTSGCPTGIRSSCGNTKTGDMFMNYMDFTNDACMNLFTYGQKARMRSLFNKGGMRYSLLTSTGINEPWTEEAPALKEDTVKLTTVLQLYPNPAIQHVTLQVNTPENWSGGELYLVNAAGIRVEKIKLISRTQKLDLTKFSPGIYFLQGVINNTKVAQKLVKL